jgi:hypothetical protein
MPKSRRASRRIRDQDKPPAKDFRFAYLTRQAATVRFQFSAWWQCNRLSDTVLYDLDAKGKLASSRVTRFQAPATMAGAHIFFEEERRTQVRFVPGPSPLHFLISAPFRNKFSELGHGCSSMWAHASQHFVTLTSHQNWDRTSLLFGRKAGQWKV